MTTQSITETAQPVNPAITEADVFAFVASARQLVTFATAGLCDWAVKPDLFIYRDGLRVHAFIDPGFVAIAGDGQTIEQAIGNFLTEFNKKRVTPQSLRIKANELEAQAREMEAAK